jgi:hypothetical protein
LFEDKAMLIGSSTHGRFAALAGQPNRLALSITPLGQNQQSTIYRPAPIVREVNHADVSLRRA